jgi:integrase
MKGSTYKRCGCTDTDGKPLGANCPRLRGKSHGTWYLYAELPNGPGGARRRKRQGGFATQRDAQAALVDLLDRVQKRTHVDAGRQTLGVYLDDWLAGKAKLRPSTHRTYAEHIRLYLKPALGHLRLDQLAVVDIERMYAAIRQLGNPGGNGASPELQAMHAARERRPLPRSLTDARLRRIHTTLMSALNTAVKRRLLPYNPAAHVELASGRRPKAVVWTEQRVAQWRATGERPKVAVWLPSQTGAFLDHAQHHRLYALLHLIAFRGLRRGEAIGLRWTEVDLEHNALTVSTQILQLGSRVEAGKPKSESGERTIALDAATVEVLRLYRARQQAEQQAWGEAWIDNGMVFTAEDGSPLVPDQVSRLFARLIKEADLPPIRLHDLRHGAATLALAGGVNLKVVSEMLGHSTIAITADTYTSVLPEVAREAAEAAARIVPRTTPPGASVPITSPSAGPATTAKRPRTTKPQVSGGRGIRTHGTSHPAQRFSRPPPSATRRALPVPRP